jgi:hypothetical protein
MNQTTTYDPTIDGGSSVGERNRVLRNTYWLLALLGIAGGRDE